MQVKNAKFVTGVPSIFEAESDVDVTVAFVSETGLALVSSTLHRTTWKTNPMGDPEWSITITISFTRNPMAKVTSKRDGETLINIGSSWNGNIAYLIAHEYVRVNAQRAKE